MCQCQGLGIVHCAIVEKKVFFPVTYVPHSLRENPSASHSEDQVHQGPGQLYAFVLWQWDQTHCCIWQISGFTLLQCVLGLQGGNVYDAIYQPKYLPESGFSALVALRPKYRSNLTLQTSVWDYHLCSLSLRVWILPGTSTTPFIRWIIVMICMPLKEDVLFWPRYWYYSGPPWLWYVSSMYVL